MQFTRILIVDDEPGQRDILAFELSKRGYHVVTASDGAEALEKFKAEKFSVVFMDLTMPGMDGIVTLQEMKKVYPEVAVILLTGHSDVEAVVKAMKAGAFHYVLKPPKVDEIDMLIKQSLEKKELKALVALYETSKVLFSTVKLIELLERVMDLMESVFDMDQASLLLLDSDGKLYIAASRGIAEDIVRTTRLAVGEDVAGRIVELGQGYLLVGSLENYPELLGIKGDPNISSSIVYPLICQGKVLGVINLSRKPGKVDFQRSDFQSAGIFASQLSQAIRNAQYCQEIEEKMKQVEKAHEELQATQDKLVQSENLAAIGRLSAGVAHEINNPLTSMRGYTQLVMMRMCKDSEDYEQLKIVLDESERCVNIVSDLLTFARQRRLKLQKVDPTDMVRDSMKVLALKFQEARVETNLHLPDSCPSIQADPSQLKQVFLNILSNAVDALSDVNHERRIEVTGSILKDSFRFCVSDNGPGIPKDKLALIFEPFFTTKKEGRGTGLGLSLSYGIMKQHHGGLSVESEEGKGTQFYVDIPLAISEETWDLLGESGSVSSMAADSSKPSKSILLVEDEKQIAQLIEKILQPRGHHIVKCHDAEAAIHEIERHKFDLIICDFRLQKKMTGRNLYEKLRMSKPGLASRFLMVTGSALHKDLELFLAENKIPYLLKPFDNQELLRVIDERLAA